MCIILRCQRFHLFFLHFPTLHVALPASVQVKWWSWPTAYKRHIAPCGRRYLEEIHLSVNGGFYLCSLDKAFLWTSWFMWGLNLWPRATELYAFPKQADELVKWGHGPCCRLGSLRGVLWDSVAGFIRLIIFFREYTWDQHCWKGVGVRKEAGYVEREIKMQCRTDSNLSN